MFYDLADESESLLFLNYQKYVHRRPACRMGVAAANARTAKPTPCGSSSPCWRLATTQYVSVREISARDLFVNAQIGDSTSHANHQYNY